MKSALTATVSGTASTVLSAVPCVATEVNVTNTSASDRCYCLLDMTSAPALNSGAAMPTALAVLSPRVAAGAVYRFLSVDARGGISFTRGCVLVSFAFDGNGPVFSALSPADANVTSTTSVTQ